VSASMPSAAIAASSIIGISAVVFGGDHGLRRSCWKVESNCKNASRRQPDQELRINRKTGSPPLAMS
jgi:hypothetical protein